MSDFWVQDGETMLFIGDSITDCGRRAAEAPLGNGYVRAFYRDCDGAVSRAKDRVYQ